MLGNDGIRGDLRGGSGPAEAIVRDGQTMLLELQPAEEVP